MDVTELMDAPEGTVRSGDEFHDPQNWRRCPYCSVDYPRDSTADDCWNCGKELDR